MRKPNIIRPVKLNIHLPEDVRTKLDMLLFSTAEGRVPAGAYSKFFVERINEYLSKLETSSGNDQS